MARVWQERPMPWPSHLPIPWLQSESRGLPLSLTSRGRQSDKEFGREISHQRDCLLRRASNQLRNNNCVTKINSAFAAGCQAGVARGAPQAAEPKPVLRGPGRRAGLAGKGEPGNPLGPLLSAPPCAPSWPPQRWSRVRVHPEGIDQVRPGEQLTPPPQPRAVG